MRPARPAAAPLKTALNISELFLLRFGNFTIFVVQTKSQYMKLNKQAAIETAIFTWIITAALALAFSFTGCKKANESPSNQQPTQANTIVKFYSTNAVVTTRVITIKVGGTEYGRLNYGSAAPTCSASGFESIMLAPGSYTVDYIQPSSAYASKQVSIIVPAGISDCIFFDLK